jgi:hypothetical protein
VVLEVHALSRHVDELLPPVDVDVDAIEEVQPQPQVDKVRGILGELVGGQIRLNAASDGAERLAHGGIVGELFRTGRTCIRPNNKIGGSEPFHVSAECQHECLFA